VSLYIGTAQDTAALLNSLWKKNSSEIFLDTLTFYPKKLNN
jgi:hypothetical protein